MKYRKHFSPLLEYRLTSILHLQFNGELSVFAFEVDHTGRRNFVSSHPETFWSMYEVMFISYQ